MSITRWNLFNRCSLTYQMTTKVSLSVWRDEAHGRFNKSNTREDDEGMEDDNDVNNSHAVEHNNPDLPPSSLFQASSEDASVNTESNRREADTTGIDFDANVEASQRSLRDIGENTSATNSPIDQDQEMWDIVDEFEKEAPSTLVPIPQRTIPEPPGPFDPGDDWDDMYL